MASVELPNFVIGLFQNEINKIKINLIKQICKDFHLDEEELIKEYTCDINLINKNLENIQIIKMIICYQISYVINSRSHIRIPQLR